MYLITIWQAEKLDSKSGSHSNGGGHNAAKMMRIEDAAVVARIVANINDNELVNEIYD